MTNYQLNDTIYTTSKYQFSGPRYEKKDTIAGKSTTTKYYVDAGHRLLSEKTIDDSGIKEYSYVYLGSQKLARISQNDASKKDEISYFLTDAIGSVAMTTYQHTGSTNVPIQISQSLLDPWGNSVRNGMFYHTTQQDFTGKVLDEVSGLYDFGFRYYDPLTAAWIGKDLVPADHNAPLSLNEYLYCLSNPLTFVDPDGRWPDSPFGQTWSLQSGFDAAFQSDFGESANTFADKAMSRLSKVPGMAAQAGATAGGDMIQSVPSSVYSGGSLLTMGSPISPVFTGLGLGKSYLDYKEANSQNRDAAKHNLQFNILGSAIGVLSPLKLAGLANAPLEKSLYSGLEIVRSVPFFINDVVSDISTGKKKK